MFDTTLTLDQQFIVRRAAELAEQMDRFNLPDGHPTNDQLQTWAGHAAGILKMVEECFGA